MDALRCPECKLTRAVFTLWRLPGSSHRRRPIGGRKSLKTRVVQLVSKAAGGSKVPSSIEGKNPSKTLLIRHLPRRPMVRDRVGTQRNRATLPLTVCHLLQITRNIRHNRTQRLRLVLCRSFPKPWLSRAPCNWRLRTANWHGQSATASSRRMRRIARRHQA